MLTDSKMAQVLDPLERPRVVKLVESAIKSAVVALSNCSVTVEIALAQIFEDTSSLILDVSPADSFFFFTSKFLFYHDVLFYAHQRVDSEPTPPSTEAQHPPSTPSLEHASGPPEPRDSPQLAPTEPHPPPTALGSIPVAEATPATPSTPATLLPAEAIYAHQRVDSESTSPSPEAQHPPSTPSLEHASGPPEPRDSPQLAPTEPHPPPTALGSIPVAEAMPVTPSTPATLLPAEAHFPTPLSPFTPFISLSLSTPPRSPSPWLAHSMPLSPELTPSPPLSSELTPSIARSPGPISSIPLSPERTPSGPMSPELTPSPLPLPTSPALQSSDPTHKGLLESESMERLPQAPREPTPCFPEHLDSSVALESYDPKNLALASSRYLKLLLDSEWRQYCCFFDQNEELAKKVLDQVFVAVSLIYLWQLSSLTSASTF
jgi:hypothetical protein